MNPMTIRIHCSASPMWKRTHVAPSKEVIASWTWPWAVGRHATAAAAIVAVPADPEDDVVVNCETLSATGLSEEVLANSSVRATVVALALAYLSSFCRLTAARYVWPRPWAETVLL